MAINHRFRDLTGVRNGRLVGVKCVGKNAKNRALWLCRCDCGVEKVVLSCNLTRDDGTRSCGCLTRDLAAMMRKQPRRAKTPAEDDLTQEMVKDLLHYDPATGVFTWVVPTGGSAAGTEAGKITTDGYRQIKIRRRQYRAHRLVWFYVYGRWPRALIDHKDGNPLNNKLSNLREATATQNAANSRRSRRNKTGFKGVSIIGKTGKYKAQISCEGRTYHFGYFDRAEDAAAAYVAGAVSLFGEFARLD